MIAYWKFSESWSNYISDYAKNPTHISLSSFMNGKTIWRYVEKPFPELASFNQTPSGSNGLPSIPIPVTRILDDNGVYELREFKITGTQGIEFWVFL